MVLLGKSQYRIMKLKKLKIKNFRNYKDQELNFDQNLNIFLGDNAQGKTNLLESIHLLSLTRSHRTYKDKELILINEDQADLYAEIENKNSKLVLELQISNKGKKTKVNYLNQSKLSDFVGRLNVVLFSPEDLSLIKGSPSVRRKFIDMELGKIKPVYLQYLNEYQKVLKQRNSLLKQQKIDDLVLDIYDEQLANYGSKLIKDRMQFIAKLKKIAVKLHQELSMNQEELMINYKPSVFFDNNIEKMFLDELKANRKKDIENKNTLKGPHRDDLAIYINEKEVQKFGSQGQQRLSTLSLKLSEVELINQEIGEYPILLLDDVMSELDNNRQISLMKLIENKVQTFITTTTLEHLKLNDNLQPAIFDVSNGIVTERNVK